MWLSGLRRSVLLVAGISVLTRAIIALHRAAIAAVGLLAIAGAAASGASFVNGGRAG